MNKEAEEYINVEISKLISFKPLYGTIFLYTKKIQTAAIPTMGVGPYKKVGLALYYNPEFALTLTQSQLRSVLIHEALHVLLQHIVRAQHYSYNHKVYNIAADLAINCNISGLPEWVYFPKKLNLADYKSAEWYYDEIKNRCEEKGKTLQDFIDSLDGRLLDDHDKWEECDDDILKEKVRAINQKAIKAQQDKKWGDIPGGLAQAIIAANKSVVDWKRELRYFISRLVQKGRISTRSRPNRRYGYTQPGTKRNYTSKILVAIDTSGSISDDDLSDFLVEINSMISHVGCDIVCFDTVIYGKPRPFTTKARELEVEGRGGTNFHPVIELAEEMGYDGLVFLTDGFAPFPPKPMRTRVLWALTKAGESVQPPFGRRVVIDKNK